MATHSGIPAWRTPWTEEPGGASVHGVAKSRTRPKPPNTHTHTQAEPKPPDETCVFVCHTDPCRLTAQEQKAFVVSCLNWLIS